VNVNPSPDYRPDKVCATDSPIPRLRRKICRQKFPRGRAPVVLAVETDTAALRCHLRASKSTPRLRLTVFDGQNPQCAPALPFWMVKTCVAIPLRHFQSTKIVRRSRPSISDRQNPARRKIPSPQLSLARVCGTRGVGKQ
jgi:hypothetical protein